MPRIEKRQNFLLLACGGLLPLIGVHVYVVAQGDGYFGPLLILDHLFNVALIGGLFVLCAAIGLYLLAAFHFSFDEPIEVLIFSVAIGCGAFAISILVLGFLFLLHGIALTGIAVLWLFVARKEIVRVGDLVCRGAAEFNAQSSRASRVVFVGVVGFLLSQALLPPRDWDALMYHLRVPAQFLAKGGVFVPEDNFHVAYVQLIHMLYLPFLEVGSLAGPALLNSVFALLLGLAVFAFARRFYGAAIASLSLTVLWASPMLLLVAITPRLDVTLAYFLLLAHFALFIAWSNWRFYHLAAVLLGLAFGVKYNALLYLAALSPLIVYVAFCKAQYIGATVRSVASFGIICTGIALPWAVKNWLLLGAPLYPFLAQRKINSWLSFVYPDLVFSESLNPKILTMLGDVRTSLNLVDLFFNPSILTVEPDAVHFNMSLFFLFLLLWFVPVPKRRTLNWLLIPPFGYLALLFLFFPKTNLRYLAPVIAPLTIGAVVLIVARLNKLVSEKKLLAAMVIVSVIVLVPTIRTAVLWIVNKQTFAYLTGQTSREMFFKNDVFPSDYYFLGNTTTYVNRHLNPDHRILMLFEARGFYFKVPVIQDNVLVNWPLLANKLSEIGCLEGSEITHVLINTGALGFYLRRGLDPEVAQQSPFSEFAERCLAPVYNFGTHTVYAVKKPS